MTRAIYIRTSTDAQDGEAQRHALLRAAEAKGWRTADWGAAWDDGASADALIYTDRGESGAKSSRPMLDQLRHDVRDGKVREVLASALDRIGRSLVDVVLLIDEWAARGVTLETLREGRLDPSTPFGRFVLQIFAALAEMERAIIRERVKAGMDRARAKGTRSGRPIGRQRRPVDVARALAMRAEGRPWRRVAMALGVPLRTLTRACGAASVAQTPPRNSAARSYGKGGRS